MKANAEMRETCITQQSTVGTVSTIVILFSSKCFPDGFLQKKTLIIRLRTSKFGDVISARCHASRAYVINALCW